MVKSPVYKLCKFAILFDWWLQPFWRIFWNICESGQHYGGRKTGWSSGRNLWWYAGCCQAFACLARGEAGMSWIWSHSSCISGLLVGYFTVLGCQEPQRCAPLLSVIVKSGRFFMKWSNDRDIPTVRYYVWYSEEHWENIIGCSN